MNTSLPKAPVDPSTIEQDVFNGRLQLSLFIMKLLEFEKVGDLGIANKLIFLSKDYKRAIHIKTFRY